MLLQKKFIQTINGYKKYSLNCPHLIKSLSTLTIMKRRIIKQQQQQLQQRTYSERIELTTTESDYLPFEKIPTASRLPLFGTKLDLLLSGSLPKLHEYIDQRHQKLGVIFREPISSIEAVFVSSPNLMRATFLYEGKFPRHPLPHSWILYNQKYNYKRGLFFMDGENWLEKRKLMNQLLLRGDCLWTIEPSNLVANKIIKQWHKLLGDNKTIEIPDLNNIMYRWSIDVLINILLGKSATEEHLEFLEPLLNEFSFNVQKIFEFSAKLYILPNNLVKMLNLKLWTDFEESVTITLALANKIIDLSLDQLKPGDGLLYEMQQLNIKRDDIQRIIADMFIAAGDTTAFSMQWSLYLLSRDINTQNQIRDEILLEENGKTCESINVRGIIRETMRLYPVAPFIGRFFATDGILGHYKIPKDTLVLLSLFTSGRDSTNFSNPLEFIPKRWNREHNTKNDCAFKAHGSLPFAMGSRSCIGRKIATTQMNVLLTKILQNFRLKLLNEKEVKSILRMVTVPAENIRISIESI